MEEEYNSLLENQTWDLVPLPSRRKLVRYKWVYRTKSAIDRKITRQKAKLLSKGFQQVHGIDSDETFAPVAKMDSIRLALAIAATQGLKRSLYSLKQASRAWYAKMDPFLLSQNFERCKSNPNVYMLKTHDSLFILVLYLDDLLITSSSASAIYAVKRTLHDRFLMTDMGPLHFFLGLEISQDATSIKLFQAKYARDILERFHMTDCKPASTPFLFGGTITFGIHHAASTALNLLGFTDSDWASDNIDRKSTSGYSLSLGSSPICWSSKKHAAIALSSAEDKYRGVVNITIQALWLQHFLTKLGVQFHQPTVIWCDNQSTLKFCRDPVQQVRTKHIKIHMHYIKDLVHDWVIDLQFCPLAKQTVAIFTKTFTEHKFHSLRDRLGVKDTVA
eukprot:PITA_25477